MASSGLQLARLLDKASLDGEGSPRLTKNGENLEVWVFVSVSDHGRNGPMLVILVLIGCIVIKAGLQGRQPTRASKLEGTTDCRCARENAVNMTWERRVEATLRPSGTFFTCNMNYSLVNLLSLNTRVSEQVERLASFSISHQLSPTFLL